MNDTESFRIWLEERNNCVTLGEIMKTTFGCEYRKHFTLLRQKPYLLNFRPKINRKEPSKNLYKLISAVGSGEIADTITQAGQSTPAGAAALPVKFDESGQMVFY